MPQVFIHTYTSNVGKMSQINSNIAAAFPLKIAKRAVKYHSTTVKQCIKYCTLLYCTVLYLLHELDHLPAEHRHRLVHDKVSVKITSSITSPPRTETALVLYFVWLARSAGESCLSQHHRSISPDQLLRTTYLHHFLIFIKTTSQSLVAGSVVIVEDTLTLVQGHTLGDHSDSWQLNTRTEVFGHLQITVTV